MRTEHSPPLARAMSQLRPDLLAPTSRFPARQPGPHLVPRPWCGCCCSHLPGVSCSYHPPSPTVELPLKPQGWWLRSTVGDPALDSQGSWAQNPPCSTHLPIWGGGWSVVSETPQTPSPARTSVSYWTPCHAFSIKWCVSVPQIPAYLVYARFQPLSLATLCSKRGQRGSRLGRPRRESQRKDPSVNWADCCRKGIPVALHL